MERIELKEAREKRGLSQRELADAIGCSRGAVSQWERGETNPQGYWLRELCKFFGRDPSELDISVTSIQLTEGQIAMLQKILGSVHLDRREALELISRVPALAALIEILPETARVVTPAQSLSQCTAAVKAGFGLLKHGEYDAIDTLLDTHMPTLVRLANTRSEYQKVAAGLAVQAKILQINLATRNLDFAAREAYCLEAVEFGELSGNPFALIAARYWQGSTYMLCYQQPQTQTAIDIFNDALAGLSSEASLGRSAICSELSVAHAQDGNETKARDYAELAWKSMPGYPEQDLWYPCLYGRAELDDIEGQMFLSLSEHSLNKDYAKKALAAFNLSLGKPAITRGRLGQTLIRKADAARGIGDLRAFAECLAQGAAIAREINSKRRKSEARAVLDKVPDAWHKEQVYRDLVKMFD